MANTIKLGFQVNVFKNKNLEDVAKWANQNGFETFELPAWPNEKHVNVDDVLAGNAGKVKNACKKYNIEITSLAFCANHLDPRERDENNAHMKKVIQAASHLEVGIVACFVGGAGGDLFSELGLFEEYFMPLVDYAEEHDVKLAIENCPAGGKNIGRSPYFWREMFEAAEDSPYLGLEFDPSHLVWLHIDWKKALQEFSAKKKVFTLHAKDTRINEEILNNRGIYEPGWWTYKIPGLGIVDWKALFDILKKTGFDGAVNIEHEDSEFHASDEKVKEGLLLGLKTLKNSRG